MKNFFNKLLSVLLVMLTLVNMCPSVGYAAHKHVGVMCGKQVTYYENITSTKHTRVVANEDKCSCGEVIGYIDERKTTENHTFKDDKCTKCGYKKEHVHKGVKCGKYITKYINITSTHHTLYTANENVCSCGKVLGYIDETKTKAKHTFKDDKCTKCGYKREHVHQGVKCGKAISKYENITATHHTLYTANENVCSCNKVLGYIDEKRVTSKHSFVKDVCTDCGYKREHVHQGVKCGKAISRYENITATHHTLYTANENVCSCNKVLGYIDENRVTSKHSFVKDVCTDCGYKREHVHQGVKCGKAISRYENITATHHTLYTANENVCSCNKVLGYIDENRVTSKHSFVKDVCTDCGYKREHVHQGVKCGKRISKYIDINSETHTCYFANENLCSCGQLLGYIDEQYGTFAHTFVDDKCKHCGYTRKHVHQGVKCGKAISKYENLTATHHTLYTANENLCSCGQMLGYIDENRVTSKHNFINDVCTDCGYKREHVHVISSSRNSKVSYEKSNYKAHKVIEYKGDNYCACGAFVSKGESTSYFEDHLFHEDVCIFCGQKNDHVHKGVKSVKPETYYSYSNEEQHVKITVCGGSYCICGEFIPEGDEQTRYEYEAHSFKDKKCTKCGYSSKSYFETAAEQTIKGDFSDDANGLGLVGQIVVGEIPFVGTAADIRDIVASESVEEFLLNSVALIPIIGSLKYSDEVIDVIKYSDEAKVIVKNSDELAELSKINIRSADEVADTMREVSRVSDSSTDGYKTFDQFKQQYGKAGEGQEWHHIVEQSQIGKSGFDSSMINNGNNMIPIDKETHHKVSGYYSRKVPGTDMSFRDWLSYKGFTFEEQQEIGIYVLEIYGIKVE